MENIKNHRGDIPITILVLGVVAVCILSIFSFVSYGSKQKATFVGIGLMETMYSVQEEINFGKGENLNPFEEGGVKISSDENKIIGEYVLKKKVLVKIEYTPIE